MVALDQVDTGPFPGVEVRTLGRAGGSVKAGLNHVTLPAGRDGAPPHCHSLEEELFYVLAGAGMLRLGRRASMRCVPATWWRARRRRVCAHSLVAGEEGLTYLAYGTREPGDSVYYPETGKVRLRGLGRHAGRAAGGVSAGAPRSRHCPRRGPFYLPVG